MCYIYHSMAKPCNTQQTAKAAGIAVMTLQRWVAAERLKGPKLRIGNGRAVRLWSKADLARLRKLKQLIYGKQRAERKVQAKVKKRDLPVFNTDAPNHSANTGVHHGCKRTSTQAPFPQVVRGPDLDRRVVLYARVSTNNGQDPEMQLEKYGSTACVAAGQLSAST